MAGLSDSSSSHFMSDRRYFSDRISAALTQHVHFPTRGSNTLDLILTVDPLNVTQVKTVSNFQFLDNVSDHVAIVFSVNSLDNAQTTTQHYESHSDFHNVAWWFVHCPKNLLKKLWPHDH